MGNKMKKYKEKTIRFLVGNSIRDAEINCFCSAMQLLAALIVSMTLVIVSILLGE